MTNFDYLKSESNFSAFVEPAISAEKIIHIDTSACVINCRRSMEFAIKWMYSVDAALVTPYQDTLNALMHTNEFRSLVDNDLWYRLNYIRKLGNTAAHTGKKIEFDEAALGLENLFIFYDFVSCCYGTNYEKREYDVNLLKELEKEQVSKEQFSDIELKALIAENKALKDRLTLSRRENAPKYVGVSLGISEYETREKYINVMLRDAGWVEGKNWINEFPVQGMPNKSGKGRIDYVLYDDAHKPLAIIEAKKTSKDVAEGRQQAKIYADIIEKKYGRRPVIFLTNGFETRIIDGIYPERACSEIYSKRDLEKWFNLMSTRKTLVNILIDKSIVDRYYQEAAIKAVCDEFSKNRRKALLVMATGSGKTRTIIELCNILLDAGWIKNILFLADRNALVTQAKRSFVNLLKNKISCTNLCEDKDNYNAHCVFSTYQTMMHVIDAVKDEEGRIYSCGHFDLVICDEAHRSIYNKYKDIFNYFDAPLVGLTATPKDEVDKNTYEIFELEEGVPTYGYELSQAVKDGYLVDFQLVETEMKFIEQGIVYNDLSEEEKIEYEETFADEDGKYPESISSTAINTWIFNEDTIKKVLDVFMANALKIEYGSKVGKTIIFAKNHNHAETILKIFNKKYPHLPDGFAEVIDNNIKYSQNVIDNFSDPKKLPQIAISVDMLDTGIDVPEILNLVFFKKVMSKAKFWQMIGRGTRLCSNLMDGEDKNKFYIFDMCKNFEFFKVGEGKPTANMLTVQSRVFNLEFQMAFKLQDVEYQTKRLIEMRNCLVESMCEKVDRLNRDDFAVRQHLRYVEQYSKVCGYDYINYEDTKIIEKELAPLIIPTGDDSNAVRFDALIYALELASLAKKTYSKGKTDLYKKVKALSKIANIPEICVKTELIQKILKTDYLEFAGIDEFEYIRTELRNIIKYIPIGHEMYKTNFTDDILSVEWKDSELDNDELKNYRAKAEFYIKQHEDILAVSKLKNNKPLTAEDIKSLESVLWNELGTKEDYFNEYGDMPLGEFVRRIVGLDMNAAKEAFSEFLNDVNLDSGQIYFVNQIVEYIVQNGMLKDMEVLKETPFTDRGSIVELFKDTTVWFKIKMVIDKINENAVV